MKKEIIIIGLGKMGKNIKLRLEEKGWKVFGFDKYSDFSLIKKISSPRVIWLMVPAGDPVRDVISSLINFLKKGDVIIDGGNSFYEDSIKRAKKLAKLGIKFLDVGVSGGIEGARKGACLMIGGEKKTFLKLKLLFKDLAKENGFNYVGKSGAGHFVKMVHNGIEYGMMQSIAEGFNFMKNSKFALKLNRIAHLYNQGSVVESRLIGWLEKALKKHGQELKEVSGSVAMTGEGEWFVFLAKKLNIPVKIIEESVRFRKKSLEKPNYTGKIITALREQFGGHKIK